MEYIYLKILNFFSRKFLIKVSFFLRPIFKLIYKGDKFIDPIDGSSYRKFLSYGYKKIRKNALCPGTLSLERHRYLWLYLTNETSILTKPLKVLHVAPEQVFLKKFKNNKFWEYFTLDLNSPLADIKADLCDLPFGKNTFDLIICNHVLEHIENDYKAIKEIYRVLKNNGMGILQVPIDLNKEKTFEDKKITDSNDRTKFFGQYDHVRIYGKDYFKLLASVGFKVDKVNYLLNIDKKLHSIYCLPENELIPIVYKV